MSAQPTVEVRSLRKVFVQRGAWPWDPVREVHAIKGVDLRLYPDQVLAVVGQSGSGKTTLARIVLGLEELSHGEILIEGRRWDQMGEAERHRHRVFYQYVPQDAMSALDPQQNALEHVSETLRVLGACDRGEARKKAEEMLERLREEQREADVSSMGSAPCAFCGLQRFLQARPPDTARLRVSCERVRESGFLPERRRPSTTGLIEISPMRTRLRRPRISGQHDH